MAADSKMHIYFKNIKYASFMILFIFLAHIRPFATRSCIKSYDDQSLWGTMRRVKGNFREIGLLTEWENLQYIWCCPNGMEARIWRDFDEDLWTLTSVKHLPCTVR